MVTNTFNKIDVRTQSIQMIYEDSSNGETYVYESHHNKKYNRYICFGPISQKEEDKELTFDDLDMGDLMEFDLGTDLEDDNEEVVTDSDLWGDNVEDTQNQDKTTDEDEEYDPNDILDIALTDESGDSLSSTDSKTEVIYKQDNVKVIDKGAEYNNDFYFKDYNAVLLFDEFILAQENEEYLKYKEAKRVSHITGKPMEMFDNNGNKLTQTEILFKEKNLKKTKIYKKYLIGDEKYVEKITLLMTPLTTFMASKGCIQISAPFTVYQDNRILIKKTFKNEKGANYTEITDTNGNVIKQIYSHEDITITFNMMGTKDEEIRKSSKVCKTKFSIPYKELEMITCNATQGKSFKMRLNSKAIYLPNPEYFLQRKNMDFIKTANYVIADTENALIDVVDYVLKTYPDKKRHICYDAETEGLLFHRWMKNHHNLVTHCISWEDNQSVIIPVRMLYEQNVDPRAAAEILKPILEVFPIIAHNGPADVRFNLYEGIDLNLQEDTMFLIKHLLPYINHYAVTGFGKAIDDLLFQYDQTQMIDLHKEVYVPSGVDFNFALLNKAYMKVYGCPDTDRCRILWKSLRPKLHTDQELAYKNTVQFAKDVAINSTFSGLGVNIESMSKAKEEAQMLVDLTEDVIYKLTGRDKSTLSLTSAVQKKNYIFGEMGADLSYARRTKQGELSADKIVVERLSKIRREVPTDIFKNDILDIDGDVVVSKEELNNLQYPFCRLLRVHGDKTKNITAFFNGIINNSIDGVYYCDFRPGGATC